jgi:hypothetical protein
MIPARWQQAHQDSATKAEACLIVSKHEVAPASRRLSRGRLAPADAWKASTQTALIIAGKMPALLKSRSIYGASLRLATRL